LAWGVVDEATKREDFFVGFPLLSTPFEMRMAKSNRKRNEPSKGRTRSGVEMGRSDFYAQKSKQVIPVRPSFVLQVAFGAALKVRSRRRDVVAGAPPLSLLSKEICCLQKSETEALKTHRKTEQNILRLPRSTSQKVSLRAK
jgi:hypothetical protein